MATGDRRSPAIEEKGNPGGMVGSFQKGIVWGVFSESTIFEVVGDGKMAPFDEKTEFFEIRKYIIDYSKNGIYDFASCEDSIDDVCKMFSDATRHGRRLDVIFITSNGNKDGDLVGLITVWDIAKL